MSTPAQIAGIIPHKTRLRIEQSGAEGFVWMIVDDDGTTIPYFSTECGTRTLECWSIEKCVVIEEQDALPPAPDSSLPVAILAPPPVPVYTQWQQRALDCFGAMYAAAKLYRETSDCGELRASCGICDNIERFTDYSSEMTFVKDNLIRTLPSYSGSYHYPVKNTEAHTSAERAWDYTTDKWLLDYGANRMEQLAELIDAIKNKWDNSLIRTQTPAQRLGLKIGDVVWHRDRRVMLTFLTDDGSQDPYFTAPDGDRVSAHLDYIERDISSVLTGDDIAVLIERSKAHTAKRKAIRAQIVELERQSNEEARLLGVIDVELAYSHGVKRIDS